MSTMPMSSIFDLLNEMDKDDIIFAYKGAIDKDLLEAVYSMMGKHLEVKRSADDIRKKFFYILTESLQNLFHHQLTSLESNSDLSLSGFVIKSEKENNFEIITGNYLLNSGVDKLKGRLETVNGLTPEELRKLYQHSLAENEFSEKGGAGLGIIEMARKSGRKLNYDFKKVNDEYSFFSLTISIA